MAKQKEVLVNGNKFVLQSVSPRWYFDLNDRCGMTGGKKRTADYIADQLADQILSGAIRGGTPLKQEELSGLLGASRIPVREALQIIEHQGLACALRPDMW